MTADPTTPAHPADSRGSDPEQGGDPPCWAHLLDGDAPASPPEPRAHLTDPVDSSETSP